MLKKIMIWLFCSHGIHSWRNLDEKKTVWKVQFVARECRRCGAVQIQVPPSNSTVFDWMDI